MDTRIIRASARSARSAIDTFGTIGTPAKCQKCQTPLGLALALARPAAKRRAGRGP